ncbi:MAG TPA: hypothetical protein VHM25_15135 [Polyangiaceae bacterium]|jgi:hypothetical protein|nr:hypothetical protein [Polyangiaceae bacterium]
MAKPQIRNAIQDPAPDFLKHLEQTFGWSEAQALDALGAYILSSKAGRALRRQLDAVESQRSSMSAA